MSDANTETIRTADLATLYWFNAGPVTVYNEWEAITGEGRKKNRKSLPLLRLLFTNPNIDLSIDSHYTVADDSYYKWHFLGRTTFGSDIKDVDRKEYLKLYEKHLEPYDLSVSSSLYSNARFVRNKQRTLGLLSIYDTNIEYQNNATWSGASGFMSGVTLGMDAPTLKTLGEDDGGQYGYFKDMIRAQVLSAVALAEHVTGGRATQKIPVLLAGTEGKTYLYDEDAASADPIRDRIILTSDEGVIPSEEVLQPEGEHNTADIFSLSADVDGRVSINDIAGPDFVREKLMELVIAQRDPKALEKWGVKKPHGLLLYGPAGTGKSMAAEALATELSAELWEIKASDIAGKWLGDTEKNMQALFDKAKKSTKPTVMFWDEIDSLVGKTDGEGSGARALEAARGIFKREVGRLGETAPNVVLVGATNHPDDIDDALVRAGRFDMKIYMRLPDKPTRIQLFANRIADVMHRHETEDKKLYDTDLNTGRLADLTDEWSGAEIVEVLRRAQMKKAIGEIRGHEPAPISQNDIETEIQLYRQER